MKSRRDSSWSAALAFALSSNSYGMSMVAFMERHCICGIAAGFVKPVAYQSGGCPPARSAHATALQNDVARVTRWLIVPRRC
jgi:hypothetical protein